MGYSYCDNQSLFFVCPISFHTLIIIDLIVQLMQSELFTVYLWLYNWSRYKQVTQMSNRDLPCNSSNQSQKRRYFLPLIWKHKDAELDLFVSRFPAKPGKNCLKIWHKKLNPKMVTTDVLQSFFSIMPRVSSKMSFFYFGCTNHTICF